MDNNFETLQNQQNLSAEQQQQAYFSAMQQMKDEEKKQKKEKRKKKLVVMGAIIGVFILLIGWNLLKTVLFPENVIGNTALSDTDISYIVNENTNNVRDTYLEKIDTQITNFVGDDDINDKKIQKKLYKQGKRAFDDEAYLGAIQIWKNCVEYKDTQELLNEANYNVGLLYEENKSYSYAASCFKNSNGFSDAADREIDCNYQHVFTELKEGRYSVACLYAENFVLGKIDNENIRKAYLWGLIQAECDNTVSRVKTAVWSACKDPNSYRDLGTKCHFIFTEKKNSSTHGQLSVEVTHTYSATNSYGGRLTDSYSYTTEKEDFSLQGMTYKEAYRVACLSVDGLMTECGYKG